MKNLSENVNKKNLYVEPQRKNSKINKSPVRFQFNNKDRSNQIQ